jgi:O-methyltransferase
MRDVEKSAGATASEDLVRSMTAPAVAFAPPSARGACRRLAVRLLQRMRLNKLAHRLYYRYLHGFTTSSPGLAPALDRCFAEAAALGTLDSGDYLEFGMFKGYAFWHAQQAARRHGAAGMRFFGFDSFAGLPEVEGVDRTDHDEFYKGQYCCPKEAVVANLNARGVDWSRTFLIEGYFRDSLTPDLRRRRRIERAAIVLVDCDLYSSTREVLDFVAPIMFDKTILIMDDWNCFGADDRRGQRRAMREFLRRSPQFDARPLLSYGAYGQAFLMRLAPGS